MVCRIVKALPLLAIQPSSSAFQPAYSQAPCCTRSHGHQPELPEPARKQQINNRSQRRTSQGTWSHDLDSSQLRSQASSFASASTHASACSWTEFAR